MSNFYNDLYKCLEGYTVVKFMGWDSPYETDSYRKFPCFVMRRGDDTVMCRVSRDEEMNDGGVLVFEPIEDAVWSDHD